MIKRPLIGVRAVVSGVLLIKFLVIIVIYCQIQNFAASSLTITQDIIFTLPLGTGWQALKTKLEAKKIIKHSYWFLWLLRLDPALSQFKAGTYLLKPTMSIRKMLLLLVNGKEAWFSWKFIEGKQLQDGLISLEKAPWIRHFLKKDNHQEMADLLGIKSFQELEGWLYPDTWYYTANTSDLEILHRAHERMKQLVNTLWQNRIIGLPYKGSNELVILASIIEKETAITTERYKVASVFINRLRSGMRLQSDPTVIYSLGNKYRGTLSRYDLESKNAYNTYINPGLPPGPISIPSKTSLRAAAHPFNSTYLYFVADGNGKLIFNINLANHLQAVKIYRYHKNHQGKYEK
ncbi:MAG: endolytic transglycosylase MltG [Candidatus Dasytiphilus stammeri]